MKTFVLIWAVVLAATGLAAAGGTPWQATGTHECYTGSSIRSSCNVEGKGYASCEEARAALVADDCCARLADAGKSIDFTNFTCTPM